MECRERVQARHGTAIAVSAMTALSMFQMLQYWNAIMPGSDLTWSAYKALFLKI